MKRILVFIIVLLILLSFPAYAEFSNPVYEEAFIGTLNIMYTDDYAYFYAAPNCEIFAPLDLSGTFDWYSLNITSWERGNYGPYMDDMEYVGSIYILFDPYTDGSRAMWMLKDAPQGKILSTLYDYYGKTSGTLEWSELGLTKARAEELLEERHRLAQEGTDPSYTLELDLNNRVLASQAGIIRANYAWADSVLEDKYGIYPAKNMIDGDLSTAWAEGNEGDFAGQVELEWEVLQDEWWCEGIAFRAGYQKNETTYYNNCRPSHMQLIIEKNDAVYDVELVDYNGWQCVIFDRPFLMEQSFFDLAILMGGNNYGGELYQDTCITEVDLIVTQVSSSKGTYESANTGTVYVRSSSNLRSGPGLSYSTVSTVGENTTMTWLGETSIDERGVAWYKVRRKNGEAAWISSKYSELKKDHSNSSSNQPQIEEILDAINDAYGRTLIKSYDSSSDSISCDLSTENYSHCFISGVFSNTVSKIQKVEVCLASYENGISNIFGSIIGEICGISTEKAVAAVESSLTKLRNIRYSEGGPIPSVEVIIDDAYIDYSINITSDSGYYYLYIK